MRSLQGNWLEHLAKTLLLLFTLDRLLKLAAVIHFYRRVAPPTPQAWPGVSLLQPITRGASGLTNNLRSRAMLDYAGEIQYLFICDLQDREAQVECTALLKAFPHLSAHIVLVEASTSSAVASKTKKLQAGLAYATGEVVCSLDDDIALRPLALHSMLPYLFEPGVGVVFGIACYTNWQTSWSSLMSWFVNANALMNYIPITYLVEPYTVTGHCFALRREVCEQIGGFDGLEQRIDDDHELARRVRKSGLRCVQTTPMIYDVNNELRSWQAYSKQMKRWFIIPQQTMLPFLSRQEQAATLLTSSGQLLPRLLAPLFILSWSRSVFHALVAGLGLSGAAYAFCELCYLKRRTPVQRWPLLPLVTILAPVQVLWALLSNKEIEWRGQRLHISVGGKMEIL